MAKYTSIGGQALIEGIMMKNPKKKTALAVRKPDKTIDISFIEEKSIKDKIKFFKLPVLRGIVTYIETMIQGYKAMMKSAEISGFTDIEEDADGPKNEKSESAITALVMTLGSVLGIALAVALFIIVPTYTVDGIEWLFKVEFSELVQAVCTQGIKIIILVLYMWIISFMKDIHRVFAYHGAEHKTIFCYEAGLELTVENVKKQKRLHPRCGTSFLMLMLIIGIFFSTVIQVVFEGAHDSKLVWALIKVAMIPLICGVGYEVLRMCGKYNNIFTRIISAPGVWIQRITTKEPDDSMLEVAIAALGEVLSEEEKEKYLPKKEEAAERETAENEISENAAEETENDHI